MLNQRSRAFSSLSFPRRHYAVTSILLVCSLTLAPTLILRSAKANEATLTETLQLKVADKVVGTATQSSSLSAGRETDELSKVRLNRRLDDMPLNFQANQGQADDRVKFMARGRNLSVFLTDGGASIVLKKSTATSDSKAARLAGSHVGVRSRPVTTNARPSRVVKMALVGSNLNARAVGLDKAAEISNYFIGRDPHKWQTNVPNYSRAKFENIYPGIDILYHLEQGGLVYDFILAPHSDPNRIVVDFEGIQKLAIARDGDLVLQTEIGAVRQSRPYIYQEVAGVKQSIAGTYVLKGKTRVGFEIGAYDSTKPLIIDPQLTYSTYLGGTGNDLGGSIAIDSSGNAYIAGRTDSTNFPAAGGFQSTLAGGVDIFIAKLNRTGNALVYSTYLGGTGNDGGWLVDQGDDFAPKIALDSSGNAYIYGTTYSNNFPVTAGAYQTTALTSPEHGPQNLFITKLNSTGNALVYSTYLGGSSSDIAGGIAVDAVGNAYVTGLTLSTVYDQIPTPFPVTTGAFQTTLNTFIAVAFVTKLNSTGTALVYSTYLGGTINNYQSGYSKGYGIAVDDSGNAYVAGYTECNDFPVTPGAYQTTTHEPANDAPQEGFVTKLNTTGSALVYSTYLGGSGRDWSYNILIDSSGNAYVSGDTSSTNFPVTAGALKTTLSGNGDVYVTKLNETGTALIYSTYVGGSGTEYSTEDAPSFALDSCGYVYLTGTTNSTDLPVTTNAYQSTFGGVEDIFIAKLNKAGTALLYSSYLGGSGDELNSAMAVDSAGDAYITGRTKSANFPVTAGAFRSSPYGLWDAFVTKFPLADAVERATVLAPDATSGVPLYTAASAEYHPGADANNFHPNATIDTTVLPDRPTEIWAKYYWPQGLAGGPYPLVVFTHGNHYSCGRTWTPFITNVTPGTVKNNSSSWLGMKITTSSQPVTVRYLGRMFLTGNTGTHAVKIVRASDNATIVSVSIPMVGGTVNQFRYVQLASPVTLAANTGYYIASQEANHGDSWYDSNTVVSSTTVATVNGRVSSNNGSSWSTTGAVPGQVYGPLDFLYDAPARTDDSSQYTVAGTYGTCPSGYTVAPSHRGYDYLANQLASWGYIVVSINTNLGMSAGAPPYYLANNPGYPDYPDDPGLNLARGRLVLKHLQQLSEWTRGVTATPAALGVDFTGKIDLGNVGFMGHSRGGEGVRAAYNLYRDAGSPWPARIVTPLTTKGIFEIAPTDGQTSRILNADGVAWNVLLPACDGDVSRLQGIRPFDRALTLRSESPTTQKSTFLVWGANHNFYNTQWQKSEWVNNATACIGTGNNALFLNPTITGTGFGSLPQQQTASGSVIPFFRANVGPAPNQSFNQNFDPRFTLPNLVTSVTRVVRAVTPSPNASVTTTFEDFDQPTGLNSSGVANDDNVSITHVIATDCTSCATVPDHFYDKNQSSQYYDFMPLPSASQLFKAGAISWASASSNTYFQTNWKDINQSTDITSFQLLDFLVGRQRSDTNPTLPHSLNTAESTNFTIQLVMADNSLSDAICLSTYADVGNPVGGANELHTILQTVRIPLADFSGVHLNLSQVRGIRFTFNKTATGAIYLANVRLARP